MKIQALKKENPLLKHELEAGPGRSLRLPILITYHSVMSAPDVNPAPKASRSIKCPFRSLPFLTSSVMRIGMLAAEVLPYLVIFAGTFRLKRPILSTKPSMPAAALMIRMFAWCRRNRSMSCEETQPFAGFSLARLLRISLLRESR